MQKPFSQACENNKLPILEVIQQPFQGVRQVLEIGSGTGQHAIYFGAALTHLVWQCSDRIENHAGIKQWLNESDLVNIKQPLVLDVAMTDWPAVDFDAAFSANTTHIMSWPIAKMMIIGIGKRLPSTGLFCLYGPFNYGGLYTSDSNAQFDQWLKQQDKEMGIRDFEAICELAADNKLQLTEDHAMPANNRLLIFRKI